MVNKIGNSSYYIVLLIFILSFSQGVIFALGVPNAVSQLSIEILILILFFKAMLNIISVGGDIYGDGLVINLLLIVAIFISFLITTVSKIQLIFFIRNFFIYYLFFYALFNIKLTDSQKERIKKLIIYLFVIQLPASFIKLYLIGTSEDYIGTISVEDGSLATIMPLFAISYLLSHYMVYKDKKYPILMLLFIGIGLISNKLGILYYVVFLYFAILYVYSKFDLVLLKNLFKTMIFLSLIFSAFVSLNPRANPEGKVGGSVDIDYLIKYSNEYQHYSEDGVKGDGRFTAPFDVWDLLSSKGIIAVLWGLGPGDIIQSSFLKYKNPLLEKYNIGYGGRLGILQLMMQIGLIGLLLALSFHILLYMKIRYVYDNYIIDTEHKVLLLYFIGLSIIYFLDTLTYSPTLLNNPAMIMVYLYSFFYIHKYKGVLNES